MARVTAPPAPLARAQVVVLGDFGRSPRMQYHALSLADQAGLEVDVVAYEGSRPREEVATHPRIHLRLISPPPAWLAARLPRVLALALRVLLQLVQLCVLMTVRLPRPDVVLLQTPPCVPSFAVCRVVSKLRGARFIIDWHNFAYTLMALQLGQRHPLVAIARRYEAFAGRFADAHLCVTDAMRDWLAGEWNIRGAVTLRDRPPAFFARASLEDAHELFARLGPALDACPTAKPDDPGSFAAANAGASARRRKRAEEDDDDARDEPDVVEVTPFTERRTPRRRASRASTRAPARTPTRGATTSGTVSRRAASDGRPALLVSSTSWTPDEDFGILLDALRRYDVLARADARRRRRTLPDLVVIVTGKGPQRSAYEARMASLEMRHVAVRTAWLSFEDYPTLLGAADLGVCLHTSSSGLDLPMKVVDMQGAGLPVAAVRYDVVRELVREEDEDEDEDEDGDGGTSRANGVLFDDGEELSRHLARLLRGWWTEGEEKTELEWLREGAAEAATERWAENWERNALPLFREATRRRSR